MKEVLAKIVPSKQEREKISLVVASVKTSLEKVLPGVSVILGGSLEKDTWLSGACDIDIFVQFPPGSTGISETLRKGLAKAFSSEKIELLHGSRDYYQIIINGYTVELVPILEIKEASLAENITDVSPLHAVWVKKMGKGLKDEIRLAKQFCRSQRLYGAESYISGFSGYILEILIISYGSFEELLKTSVKWKKKMVVDPSSFYPKKDALFHLNSSKTHSPLVIVDPVDKFRNAAAALSEEKWSLFRKRAREYLKKPSALFFEEKTFDVEALRSKKGHLVYLEFEELDGKRDVVGAKLLKVFDHLKKSLEEFGLLECDWDWNQMYYILKIDELPEFSVRRGPPVNLKEACDAFKKKHKKAYVKDGVLYADIKNVPRSLKKFVSMRLKDTYVVERVKGSKIKN